MIAYAHIKRIGDFAIASVATVLLMPLFAVLALAVKLESKGPALFIQERTGLGGKAFMMYKFRSMTWGNDVLDTTKANQLTKVGEFLRKTSLDELPQIINVLKGDMSFIGPRPWITDYHKYMNQTQRRRNSVRPGITGRAQAYGRNALDIDQKIQHDLDYVANVTLREDMRVILQTCKTVFDKSVIEIEKFGIHDELKALRLQNNYATEGAFYAEVKTSKSTHSLGRVSRRKVAKMKFSVLMSVYAGERADHLDAALSSVFNQTRRPNEVVLVLDGPLTPALDCVIDKYSKQEKAFVIVALEKNVGLGVALGEGMKRCKYEYIARMDSDDVSIPSRFEKQIEFIENHPDVDLVGACILEYNESMDKVASSRQVPEYDYEIKQRMKSRNPINHMTVVYRKSKVLECAGYEDCPYFEDYYLWCKLAQKQARFYNIQDSLVHVRGGTTMIARRGGYQYAMHTLRFQIKANRLGTIGILDAIRNTIIRVPISLAPSSIRGFVYSNLLRNTGQ